MHPTETVAQNRIENEGKASRSFSLAFITLDLGYVELAYVPVIQKAFIVAHYTSHFSIEEEYKKQLLYLKILLCDCSYVHTSYLSLFF